jgi:two-component system, OmpR family, KDP operon response regulator KdpE
MKDITMKQNILVVDNEPQIRKQLKIGLTGYGYEVTTASNGEEAITLTAQLSPHLIVMEISLGSEPDGLEVCKRLREWSTVPIIILSVHHDQKTKVTALYAGADDYITKPFGMEELHARILTIFRRIAFESGVPSKAEIVVEGLRIDLAKRIVYVEDEEVHLAPKEYDVLALLATHAGKVVTHSTILNEVWGPSHENKDNYVRVTINQIRKKLRENPARNLRYILNEPGIGYRFVEAK